jgi:hypothetical protein
MILGDQLPWHSQSAQFFKHHLHTLNVISWVLPAAGSVAMANNERYSMKFDPISCHILRKWSLVALWCFWPQNWKRKATGTGPSRGYHEPIEKFRIEFFELNPIFRNRMIISKKTHRPNYMSHFETTEIIRIRSWVEIPCRNSLLLFKLFRPVRIEQRWVASWKTGEWENLPHFESSITIAWTHATKCWSELFRRCQEFRDEIESGPRSLNYSTTR